MSQLSVTSSPHIRNPDTVPRIMWSVAAALTPALVAAGYLFGWRALYVTAISVVTAVASEYIVQVLRKVPVTVSDGSAVVTGMLVAFCLPPGAPWYVPLVASAAAILVAKQAFGGLGYNIWNPALVGRAVVHWAYADVMNASVYPVVHLENPSTGPLGWLKDFFRHFAVDGAGASTLSGKLPADVVTGASPMKILKGMADGSVDVGQVAGHLPAPPTGYMAANGPSAYRVDLVDALLGHIGGNLGEVCAALLLAGAIYLALRGIIRWYVPVLYIGTVALLVAILPLKQGVGDQAAWVWAAAFRDGPAAGLNFIGYHLLCGGLMLGALYMATDMVTSPLTRRGLVIFALGCGVLTSLIRLYGGYPEGVCYSILLMNTAVPLIDRWTQPRVFGMVKRPKGKGGAR